MQYGHIPVGRDDVDSVWFYHHPVSCLNNFHVGCTLQQLRQDPLVGWVKMLDNDKGHAALVRHMP